MYGDKPIVGVCRPKSPAREAGIQPGDLILRINDVPVRRHVELKHVLGPMLAGDLVKIDFQRDGETFSKAVELTDKLVPYEHPFLGILPVRNALGEASEGVRIRYVYEGSPAANKGLQAGDALLSLNDQPMVDADELRDAIASFEPADNIVLSVTSGGEASSIELALAAMTESVPATLPDAFPERETFDEQLPPLGKINVKLPEEEGNCTAYIPESYDPRFEHALVVLLPVPGKDKADDLVVQWRSACNDAHVILLLPQAKEARSWLPTETAFIRKTIENVRNEYTVDPARIAVLGSDNSGAMAYLCAFTHRDLIRGVAAIRAPVPANSPVLINEPLQRLAAFVGAPQEGRMAERVKSDVAQLRAARIPVTQKEVTGSEIDDDLRAELIRWVDTLDRI